ncbi:MAG: hypothetical protein CMI52_04335 [Parcubacteria group bacterium]|nr:hypothetical protein [Parcubacteria group bacterium]|tara:strand:- start:774 stop:1316 length:543 start_codon:yes stop_codon:yes gene_type:complete
MRTVIYFCAGSWNLDKLALRIADLVSGRGNNWFLSCVNPDHRDMRLTYRYGGKHFYSRMEVLRRMIIWSLELYNYNTLAESVRVELLPMMSEGFGDWATLAERVGSTRANERIVTFDMSSLLVADMFGQQIVPDMTDTHPGDDLWKQDMRAIAFRQRDQFPGWMWDLGVRSVSLRHVSDY